MATLYLDESKAKNYVFIGILVPDGDAPRLRKRVSALKMPRQRSIHFVKEAESRRRKLIDEILDLEVTAVRIQSNKKNQMLAREGCIRAIVRYAQKYEIESIVFERDESAVTNDEKWLKSEIRKLGPEYKLGYLHLARNEEPLLWVSDAIAWCDARGGDWKRRVSATISESITAPS